MRPPRIINQSTTATIIVFYPFIKRTSQFCEVRFAQRYLFLVNQRIEMVEFKQKRILFIVDRFVVFAIDQYLNHSGHSYLKEKSPTLMVQFSFFSERAAFSLAIMRLRIAMISRPSPTTPRSAALKIGASGSLLIAMIVFEEFMPTRC